MVTSLQEISGEDAPQKFILVQKALSEYKTFLENYYQSRYDIPEHQKTQALAEVNRIIREQENVRLRWLKFCNDENKKFLEYFMSKYKGQKNYSKARIGLPVGLKIPPVKRHPNVNEEPTDPRDQPEVISNFHYTPVLLSEKRVFKDTKPSAFGFDGEIFLDIFDWNKLTASLFFVLYEKRRSDFNVLVDNKNLWKVPQIASSKRGALTWANFEGNVFVKIHLGAEDHVKFIKKVFKALKTDINELEIFLKREPCAS